MVVFTSLLLSLLFGLAPLVIAALMVPVLCQDVVVSLPRSFLVTHVTLSLLTRPFLELASRIWLLLPVLPLLAAAPAFISAYASLAAFFFLSNTYQSLVSAVNSLSNNFSDVNPFDVKENVRESCTQVFASLERFMDHTNFTEMFQDVRPPSGDSGWSFFHEQNESPFSTYNFSEAFQNLTFSDSSLRYIDNVNVAVIGLLENIEISNFFNTTRLPPNLSMTTEAVAEAFRDLARHLNFTEILKDSTVSPQLQDSLGDLGTALEGFGQNFNFTELLEATIAASHTADRQFQNFSLFADPAAMFLSHGKSAGTASWGETIRVFVAWVPAYLHIIAFLYAFLLFIGIPCLFVLRAALQDACLWLVTRRYESKIPSEQRSAGGWMLVAAISGLALAAAEAFPYCCFYFYLYHSNVLSVGPFFVLFVHTLTAAPLRAASQMRIAEAGARRDVLKDNEPGFISGYVLAAFTNGIFSLWWLCCSVALVTILMTVWLSLLIVSTEVCVAGLAIVWGRRVCGRVLRDEQRLIEDRERKRD